MKKNIRRGAGQEKQVAANKKFPCEGKTYSAPLVQWKIILTMQSCQLRSAVGFLCYILYLNFQGDKSSCYHQRIKTDLKGDVLVIGH